MLRGVRLGDLGHTIGLPVNKEGVYEGGRVYQDYQDLTILDVRRRMYVPVLKSVYEEMAKTGFYYDCPFYDNILDFRQKLVTYMLRYPHGLNELDNTLILSVDVTGLDMKRADDGSMRTNDYIDESQIIVHSEEYFTGYDYTGNALRFERNDIISYHRTIKVFLAVAPCMDGNSSPISMLDKAERLTSHMHFLNMHISVDECIYYMFKCYLMGLFDITMIDNQMHIKETEQGSYMYYCLL